jgi:hypothetical protein
VGAHIPSEGMATRGKCHPSVKPVTYLRGKGVRAGPPHVHESWFSKSVVGIQFLVW